ncbi:MAG TPA: hypothetical protein VNO43_00490 [Candidatus Eisenbacteria bacterium]|nr:hypothetical protein [Candidatus Eisenbacteria bacterium]
MSLEKRQNRTKTSSFTQTSLSMELAVFGPAVQQNGAHFLPATPVTALPAMHNVHFTSVRLVIIALCYLVLAAPAVTSTIVLDPDIWWHLKTGEWIIQHRMVPTEDPFSTFGTGQTWIAYSWLFEVFVYLLYRAFGLNGIVILVLGLSLCIAVTTHLMIRAFRPSLLVETVLLALVFIALIPLLTPRPWLFSILFLSVELGIIGQARRSGNIRVLWLLPPVFALWANLHIQFVYGLAVVALLLAEILWKAFAGSESHKKSVIAAILIAFACVLAVAVNPYQMKIFWPVMDYVQHTTVFHVVSEFQPLRFRSAPELILLLLGFAAVYVLGWRKDWNPFAVTLLLMGMFLGFSAKRDSWVLAITGAMVLSERLGSTARTDSFALKAWHAFVVCPLVALPLYVLIHHRQVSERSLQDTVAKHFPVAAVRYIRTAGYGGPLFNHFNWGGFLIWSLPELRVSMDGRTNVHGDRRIERSITTWFGQPGWDSDPELLASKLVITGKHWALTSLLRMDRRFDLVYEDSTAAVFVPRTSMEGDDA